MADSPARDWKTNPPTMYEVGKLMDDVDVLTARLVEVESSLQVAREQLEELWHQYRACLDRERAAKTQSLRWWVTAAGGVYAIVLFLVAMTFGVLSAVFLGKG